MNKKVILYDFSTALGGRPASNADLRTSQTHTELAFYFPDSTKAIFQDHRAYDDHVIIYSDAFFASEIKELFTRAGIELPDSCEILDIEAYIPAEHDNNKLVLRKKTELTADSAVIVDHRGNIGELQAGIVYIPVPSDKPEQKPTSGNYLQVTQFASRLLEEAVVPNIAALQGLPFNCQALEKTYERWIHGHRLMNELRAYRDERQADFHEYQSTLGRLFKPKFKDRDSKINAADSTIISVINSMIANTDFNHKNVEIPAAKSGELKHIVRSYGR